jgi:predicted helicase
MKNQPKPAQVFHFDLFGKREEKYDFLNNESLDSIPWTELDCPEPYCFFVPKDFSEASSYVNGFKLDEIFKIFSTGAESQKDEITIQIDKKDIQQILNDFFTLDAKEIASKYSIIDGRDWKVQTAKDDLNHYHIIDQIQYRPFDVRLTSFSGISKGFFAYPRFECLKNLMQPNLAITSVKLNRKYEGSTFWITKLVTDKSITSSLDNSYIFPVYIYPIKMGQQSIDDFQSRQPNLNLQIVEHISEKVGLRFTPEKEEIPGTFAPIDLLDYIYAVLHSPTYREKYKEFLKIDFPRVPYPKDAATFWHLVALGGELRQIHLLESPVVNKYITQYPVRGSNVVEKVRFENGNVYINDAQHFANVPEVAWKFYIGGYQPAQKWLKDRKGRELQFDDIMHYQKIIVALSETDRLMKKIDEIVQL